MVDFVASQPENAPPAGPYKILRLLPGKDSDHRYLVKTISEAFERIANECELVSSSPSVVAYR
jgi:hypothetical protein